MGVFLLLVYLAGCMFSAPFIARFILVDSSVKGFPNDSGDYWMSAALALCICWCWPLLIPGWWLVQFLKNSE